MTKEHPQLPDQQLIEMLFALVPVDGSTVGNTTLMRAIDEILKAKGQLLNEDDYWRAQASLVTSGVLSKGQGRGGSVRRTNTDNSSTQFNESADGFELETQQKPATAENTQNLRSAANLLM